uniref:Uncharacterized protein n=1 Tax=Amphimedon queenslandica TaxID=400682 RepID=A0A1X7TI46_AMPQE
MAPSQLGKWLVLFSDEINLPDLDKYDCRAWRILQDLRSHVVTIERIQFVGACNPPTDRGRKPLSHRIITELETLKEEAPEVQRKLEETDTVMAEVDRVSQQYLPLSTSCSAMYFTLESLNQVVDLRLNSSSQGLISHSYTEDLWN